MRVMHMFLFAFAGAASAAAPHRVDESMAAFFSGRWTGAGAFANGKPIAADVSVERDLDGQWLVYRHTDKAPNQFKALGMWGYDRASDKLVMTVNDNFGGVRQFDSAGWDGERITFTRPDAQRSERFRFERVDAAHFRMTYEVSTDASTWRLGDSLLFERQP